MPDTRHLKRSGLCNVVVHTTQQAFLAGAAISYAQRVRSFEIYVLDIVFCISEKQLVQHCANSSSFC